MIEKKEAEGSKIEVSMNKMMMSLKFDFLLGSNTKFLLNIGSVEDSINPYFMHVWINREHLEKFRKQIDEVLKEDDDHIKKVKEYAKLNPSNDMNKRNSFKEY